MLTDGRKLTAQLLAADDVLCELDDAWAIIPRNKIDRMQIHLENMRPPRSHLTDVENIGSRKGGPPYASITLRNGQAVTLEAARWVIKLDTYPQRLEKASFLPEGQDKARDIEVTKLLAVRWRGARPDEVRLTDGTELKGRLDFPEPAASLFGKLQEFVWGYVPVDEIRKVEFLSEKPPAQEKPSR